MASTDEPLFGVALLRPPADPAWEAAPIDPQFVMAEEGGLAPRLILSEVAPDAAQAVALSDGSSGDLGAALRAVPVPDRRRMRLDVVPELRRATLTFESPRAAGTVTHCYGVLNLTLALRAHLEVHTRGSDPARASRLMDALMGRVIAGGAGVLPTRRGEVVTRVLGWTGPLLVVLGGLLRLAPDTARAAPFVILGGLAIFLAVTISALVRGLRAPGRGVAFADRVATLWQNPWILASLGRALGVPLVILAVMFAGGPGRSAGLQILYWGTLLLGVIAVVLGSEHRLIKQVLRRREVDAEPIAGGTWAPLADVPESFPPLPDGRVMGIYRHSSHQLSAVVVRTREESQPAWTRWNQAARHWETPRGRVMAREYQMWDGRVETVVEAHVGGEAIVVESVAPADATFPAVRTLTESLPDLDGATPSRSGPVAFLGYPYLPAVAAWAVGPIMLMFLFATHGRLGLAQFIGIPALVGVAVPVYYFGLSIAGCVRPRWFRIPPAEIARRAKAAWAIAVVPCAGLAFVVAAWVGNLWPHIWPARVAAVTLVVILTVAVPLANAQLRGRARRRSA